MPEIIEFILAKKLKATLTYQSVYAILEALRVRGVPESEVILNYFTIRYGDGNDFLVYEDEEKGLLFGYDFFFEELVERKNIPPREHIY